MPGHQYEVGASLATLFIAERSAEPVTGAPTALAIPLNEFTADTDAATGHPVREIRSSAVRRTDGPAP